MNFRVVQSVEPSVVRAEGGIVLTVGDKEPEYKFMKIPT